MSRYLQVKIRIIFLICFVIALPIFAAEPVLADDQENRKAVLITGASSGIGRNTAERLAKNGYFVYAGARKDSDMEALDRIENVKAVRLDVTDQQQIDAALKLIRGEGRGLWGVVNNAGVASVGPMIETEEEEIDFLFDVNVYGVWRVTKAFAPMVIESQGRIVNISSISGILSGPQFGLYSMSKHAVEAMTDSMDREMRDLGVRVIAVEPGNYNSAIGNSMCKRMAAGDVIPENTRFEEFWTRRKERCKALLAGDIPEEQSSPEPDQVAAAIENALFAEKPFDHYMVVPEQWQAGYTIGKAMEELLNLNINTNDGYGYTRDELVQLMDMMWPWEEERRVWDEDMGKKLDAWMNKQKAEP